MQLLNRCAQVFAEWLLQTMQDVVSVFKPPEGYYPPSPQSSHVKHSPTTPGYSRKQLQAYGEEILALSGASDKATWKAAMRNYLGYYRFRQVEPDLDSVWKIVRRSVQTTGELQDVASLPPPNNLSTHEDTALSMVAQVRQATAEEAARYVPSTSRAADGEDRIAELQHFGEAVLVKHGATDRTALEAERCEPQPTEEYSPTVVRHKRRMGRAAGMWLLTRLRTAAGGSVRFVCSGTGRVLTLAVLAVALVVGGGYWFIRQRNHIPTVAELLAKSHHTNTLVTVRGVIRTGGYYSTRVVSGGAQVPVICSGRSDDLIDDGDVVIIRGLYTTYRGHLMINADYGSITVVGHSR